MLSDAYSNVCFCMMTMMVSVNCIITSKWLHHSSLVLTSDFMCVCVCVCARAWSNCALNISQKRQLWTLQN